MEHNFYGDNSRLFYVKNIEQYFIRNCKTYENDGHITACLP